MARRISVTVQPNARSVTIAKIGEREFRAAVGEPARDGKANQSRAGALLWHCQIRDQNHSRPFLAPKNNRTTQVSRRLSAAARRLAKVRKSAYGLSAAPAARQSVGEDRKRSTMGYAAGDLGEIGGQLHGAYDRASFQRRDRRDPAAHHRVARFKPRPGRRARFGAHFDGGGGELSIRLFCRPGEPPQYLAGALHRPDRTRMPRHERRFELFRLAGFHGAQRFRRRRCSSAIARDLVGEIRRPARVCARRAR